MIHPVRKGKIYVDSWFDNIVVIFKKMTRDMNKIDGISIDIF